MRLAVTTANRLIKEDGHLGLLAACAAGGLVSTRIRAVLGKVGMGLGCNAIHIWAASSEKVLSLKPKAYDIKRA